MSIPTTMKFIVRGKSVDFRNREGSSPSIPNKKLILLPKYLSSFFSSAIQFKQNSLSFSFTPLFHNTNVSELKSLDLIPIWIDTIPLQINIYGQRISIIESFTVHIIILTLTSKIFDYF